MRAGKPHQGVIRVINVSEDGSTALICRLFIEDDVVARTGGRWVKNNGGLGSAGDAHQERAADC